LQAVAIEGVVLGYRCKTWFVVTRHPVATTAVCLATFIYVVTSFAIATRQRYCGNSEKHCISLFVAIDDRGKRLSQQTVISGVCPFVAIDTRGNSLSQQKEFRGAI
jgi:hypothetical protein